MRTQHCTQAKRDKFGQLQSLGAGEFAHLNGSLEKHLTGTYSLLKSWFACDSLCDAGLYHAAYGTAGFEQKMLGVDDRHAIRSIIGSEAEAIVYLYCACDRQIVFAGLKAQHPVGFRDRFTGQYFDLSEQQAHDFCELTVANELDIAMNSASFIEQHGAGLKRLFAAMACNLTEAARQDIKNVLGKID